jgi:hypothetical protein
VGDSAREATTAALSTLGDDWCVSTGVGWPSRGDAVIDHVVVGPGGVFVIDSRHWAGSLEMREDGLRQNGRLRNDATNATTFAAFAVSDVLDLDVSEVHPVLCLVREGELTGWAGDVFVTTSQDLAAELTECPPVLGPDDVARIGGLVTTELPPVLPKVVTAEPKQEKRELYLDPTNRVSAASEDADDKSRVARSAARRIKVALLVGLLIIAIAAVSFAVLPNLGDAAASRSNGEGALGDTIEIVGAKTRPDLEVTAAKVVAAEGVGPAARPGKGMRLVAVRFEIDNVGTQRYDAARWWKPAVIDQVGTTYRPADRVTQLKLGPLLPDRPGVRPGRSVRGWVVFEIPRKATIDAVTLSVGAGAQTATWSTPQSS